jgi:hypothetical protein
MKAVAPHPLPASSLLQAYAASGAYTDCFVADVPHHVPLADYVVAFYTSPVFRIERLLLHWFLRRPATDAQARELAGGGRDRFSAWHVEGRGPDELLMCDLHGRTRSWFMVAAAAGGGTRLHFGSAVVPVTDRATGERRLGTVFALLLGFHKLYSRVLLAQARSRLLRSAPPGA